MNKLSFFLFIVFFSSQAQGIVSTSSEVIVIGYKEKKLSDSLMKKWHHKDVFLDTIPGISSERLYKELLLPKGDTVVVAVIDSGIDIHHEDLKDNIWTNTNEIPNNNKDDDKNGYIDDIHGWNFLGNKKGESIHYARYEFVRILERKGLLDKNGLKDIDMAKDSITNLAIKYYKEAVDLLEEDKNYILNHKKEYQVAKIALKEYFPNQNYNLKRLRSIDTIANKALKNPVDKLCRILKYKLTEDWINSFEKDNSIIENYKLNFGYDDRKVIGDDPYDLKKRGYGNNNVTGNSEWQNHGTLVAGIIGASRENNLGVKGVADKIKLMSIRAIPGGDEYDKDVALAIRYAVDNGAKIINMSFGKDFSPQEDFVIDAINYASKKDVLIVHAAGNDSNNLDKKDFFPNDIISGNEIVDNFINVGALNYKLNRKLPAYFSNYGKTNIDVFAPGHNLYSTSLNNQYALESGTSFAAPIVSGIAAIIRSRFPNLNASEIKSVILNSGISYRLNVTVPGKRGTKVPFSELSKSGKVVNAYNALLMAEEVSNKN